MAKLTPAQQNTIDTISSQLQEYLVRFANQTEVTEISCVLDCIALHNVFISIHHRNIEHVYGFWILPTGEILKVADENISQ